MNQGTLRPGSAGVELTCHSAGAYVCFGNHFFALLRPVNTVTLFAGLTYMRKLYLVLLLVLIPSVLPRLRHLVPILKLEDFVVYDTASVLVREHQGIAIYDGADDGQDPQLRFASPGTRFATAARRLGAQETRLYVYPPILADMVVPLSFVPLRTAGVVWTIFNYVALAAIAGLLISLLALPWIGLESITLIVALLCAQPIVSSIVWGQITLFLAFLWLLGMWLYREGWTRTSAAVFAVAAAIKVVPLVAVFPFLIWREWRWVRSFAVALLLLTAGMCFVNGPSTLMDFVFHVLPPMSRGVSDVGNQTILCGIQLLYQLTHHGDIMRGIPEVPRVVIVFGKVCSLILLLLAMKPLIKVGGRMDLNDRLLALFFIYMISNPIAPVTWAHGYVPSAIGLAVCWVLAFRRGISPPMLLLLAACTIGVSSFAIHTGMSYFLLHGRRDVLVVGLSIFTPIAVVILSLAHLASLSGGALVIPVKKQA